jgi:thiosulfate dehydrogenase [quinone] large subunit
VSEIMTRLSPHERALLPLRAFLAVTFCFAGLQKLANHGFFDASDPASIQAQLAASARRSPIHVLLTPLQHVAIAVGLLIALGELAVGIGTLLGLWSRLAAAGGMVLSLMLFLTVSFHSSPYYTGADIVFLFAWTPLLLAPPSALTLDVVLADRVRRETASRAKREVAGAARRAAGPRQGKAVAPVTTDSDDSRREAMLKGIVTAGVAFGALVLGGLTAAVGRVANGSAKNSGTGSLSAPTAAAPTAAGSTAPGTAASSGSGASGASGSASAGAHAVGSASAVPIGSAADFTDPATGDPAIVLHPNGNTFLAFDAVCPHAGCTVQYDPSATLLVCPCHGSQFNASTGAVELGPAATGLRPIPISRGPGNQLYTT